MTRAVFEQQLSEVQEEMLVLAGMVDAAIQRSIQALRERDESLAHQVISEDVLVNQKRYEIEEKCLELIATQQPLAGDLRTIVAVLFIAGELERMGDHAEGIAKIAILGGDEPPLRPLADIPLMAEIARRMLVSAIDSFKDRDSERARKICDEDDEVDALYEKVYRELIGHIIDDPATTDRATHLTWAAHNLERIADRVTNICERVVYLVEGRIQELNVSKY